MREWYFKIGKANLCLSTSEKSNIELYIHRFQCIDEKESSEDAVQINLQRIEDIPTPTGTKCQSPQEHPVWINGTKVSRLSWDYFRKEPHMRIDYDLLNPNKLNCYVRSEYLPWAVTEKYIWAGVGLQYILLHHNHLIFHASYIKYRGKGIIFIAPSGTGKSTQAALWEKYRNAEIINGDKACVEVSETPMVYGIPFDGTSGICKDVSCPLCGIVFLEQAKENIVAKLPSALAIQALFSNVFVDRAVHQEWNKALDLIIKLMENVPVYHLKCTPDERAVDVLEQTIKSSFDENIGGCLETI